MNKKLYVFFSIPIVLVVCYFWFALSHYSGVTSRGQFGDMFGGVNALFSGFAFLGIIYTIVLQKEELSLQRKELELTRKELARTAKAQEESQKELSKQAASLKMTAKLNGLSSKLQYRSSLMQVIGIGKYGVSSVDPRLKEEAESIEREIDKIIDNK